MAAGKMSFVVIFSAVMILVLSGTTHCGEMKSLENDWCPSHAVHYIHIPVGACEEDCGTTECINKKHRCVGDYLCVCCDH
ncbi:unnamed protein product [Amaranthus hypochondriacus]